MAQKFYRLETFGPDIVKYINANFDMIRSQLDGTNLRDKTVGNQQITDLAIDEEKLAALAVTAAKLANSSVTAVKIANLAVGTAAIANLAVTNAKLGSLSVSNAKIGNLEVDNIKIANSTLTAGKISRTQKLNTEISLAAGAASQATIETVAQGTYYTYQVESNLTDVSSSATIVWSLGSGPSTGGNYQNFIRVANTHGSATGHIRVHVYRVES